jgi:NAD(P)-dependent dehydrogenase (short-subunit alcohol dehydrogenase family)
MDRLKGKVALITGAANGIGLATTVRFAAEGASVVAVDRKVPDDSGVPGVSWVAADVVDAGAMAAAVAACDRLGGVDVCVANAGVGRIENFTDGSRESWLDVIDVNVLGAMVTMQLAARSMIARGRGGRLLATASIAGLRGEAHAPSTAYAASKGAVMALIRALACELADHGITANAVAPGQIDTLMNFSDLEVMSERVGRDPYEVRDEFLATTVPARRMGRPEEVAGLFTYLASDEAAYVNGATLRIDGGELAI